MAGWRCVHCGAEVLGGADICPNCEGDPYNVESDELLNVKPANFRKFLAGKLGTKEKEPEKQQ